MYRFVITVILFSLILTTAATAEGILPLPQTPPPIEDIEAISLHGVTGQSLFYKKADESGIECHYLNVSYACYKRFSIKLAEEGFSLVSAKTDEDGSIHAVVSDGSTELKIDYNIDSTPNKQEVYVTYPPHVYPRERRYYEDFEVVSDGQVFTPDENISAKPIGWEMVDYYKIHWHETLTSPPRPRTDTYETDEENQMFIVRFEVHYDRKSATNISELLTGSQIRFAGEYVDSTWHGRLSDEYDLETDGDKVVVEGEQTFNYGLAFSLTKEQMEHLDEAAINFVDMDHAVNYVYFLGKP